MNRNNNRNGEIEKLGVDADVSFISSFTLPSVTRILFRMIIDHFGALNVGSAFVLVGICLGMLNRGVIFKKLC